MNIYRMSVEELGRATKKAAEIIEQIAGTDPETARLIQDALELASKELLRRVVVGGDANMANQLFPKRDN
jgi:hypothetical protein